MSYTLIGFSILIIACIYLIAKGIRMIASYLNVRRQQNLVIGKVIDYKLSNKKELNYLPLVEFETQKGQQIKVLSKVESTWRLKVGTSVLLYYDQRNPEKFYFKNSSAVFIGAFLILFFGIVSLLSLIALLNRL